MTFTPTGEQAAAVAAFRTGQDLVLEAGAGAGKTSTLRLLAEAASGRRCLYLAFNKAIAVEAGQKMPRNVTASTAHSLAYRAVGYRYRGRLNGGRLPVNETARILGFRDRVRIGDKDLTIAALARVTMETVTRFCRTVDAQPEAHHVPMVAGLDALTADGRGQERGPGHRQLVRLILPAARAAWTELQGETGQLRFTHDHYLKMWADTRPRLPFDVILFDEAQDADPLIRAVVEGQNHAQRVVVGDRAQQIYGWRGAVDAMSSFPGVRLPLAISFRFGQPIADLANGYLTLLGSPLRLTGAGGPSRVAPLDTPDSEPADAILCRTNAGAIDTLMALLDAGRKVHLVGGASDVEGFCRAAADLKAGRGTIYPDLAAFTSWGQVQEYVADDPGASDIATLVRLIDDHGPDVILDALRRCAAEADADTVVSTAHKAKGREWDRVRIAGDFAPRKGEDGPATPTDDDLRLAYVAITRARLVVDPGPLALDPADLIADTLPVTPPAPAQLSIAEAPAPRPVAVVPLPEPEPVRAPVDGLAEARRLLGLA